MCVQSPLAYMTEDDVNIRIKRDTWKRLHNRKEPGDSFNDVLQRLIEESEESGEKGNPTRMTPETAD